MGKVIKSYSDLYKIMEQQIQNAIDNVAIDVENLINEFLQKWYDDYEPIEYQRNYKFLKSCVRTQTKNTGGKITASVYIDTDNFSYGDITGLEVATWANRGIHGNPQTHGVKGNDGVEFWDDAIDMMKDYQMVQTNFIEYLKKNGINVIYKGR